MQSLKVLIQASGQLGTADTSTVYNMSFNSGLPVCSLLHFMLKQESANYIYWAEQGGPIAEVTA